MRKIQILTIAMLLLFGCEQPIGHFTIISSKNVDLANLDIRPAQHEPEVEGVDSKMIIVFWGSPASLEEAIDRAIEKGGGTALVDASLYVKFWYIPYLVGQRQFRAEGKVIGK